MCSLHALMDVPFKMAPFDVCMKETKEYEISQYVVCDHHVQNHRAYLNKSFLLMAKFKTGDSSLLIHVQSCSLFVSTVARQGGSTLCVHEGAKQTNMRTSKYDMRDGRVQKYSLLQ